MKPQLVASTVAIFILLASACGGGGEPGPDATPASTDSGASAPRDATPVGVSTDPAIVLPAISAAMAEAGSWLVEARLTVMEAGVPEDEAPALVTIIEAGRAGPGVNIIVTNSTVRSGFISGSTSAENRIIDGKRYRRDPGSGAWTVSDASGDAPSLTVDADVVGQIDVSTASVTGTDLDGEEVFHVTGTVPGVDAAVKVEVFAGVLDNLVRMIRLEGTAPVSNFGGLLPGTDEMLPQTVEARYTEYGRPITVHVPPGIDEAEDIEVRTYLSTINPFTMQIPGELRSAPRTRLMGETFNGPGGEALFIVEEYLDPETDFVGELFGQAVNVQTYARRFEIALDDDGIYEIASNEAFTTASGLEARLIRFSESDGDVRWLHLVFLHGDDEGFGATYGALAGRFAEIEDAIMAAFRSFDIVE
ncbi:MAG: hypothetical protein IIC30_03465 [Chloroflexi bacterium]|nr:hypothetical protein [Chloroflexota bacterium]